MVDLYCVVGNSNYRKSAAIRALTGAPGKLRPTWAVQYAAGPLDTYVAIDSLQEQTIDPTTFVGTVTQLGHQAAIVALRYNVAMGMPNADQYIAHFIASGWNVAMPVLFGNYTPLSTFPTAVQIQNAWLMPANNLAAQLRTAWPIV